MWLDLNLFVFLNNSSHDLSHDLISDVVNVSATLSRADRIDKGDLLKGAITKTTNHLPSVRFLLHYFGKLLVLFILEIVV